MRALYYYSRPPRLNGRNSRSTIEEFSHRMYVQICPRFTTITTNRFMMKNISKKKQPKAAATIGPTYHSIDGWMALFNLVTSDSSFSAVFLSSRVGISPGGVPRMSNDNGIENGLEVYKFCKTRLMRALELQLQFILTVRTIFAPSAYRLRLARKCDTSFLSVFCD